MRKLLLSLALVAACANPQPAAKPAPHKPATSAAKAASAWATASETEPLAPTIPPFNLSACEGFVAKLPRGIAARSPDGAVSFFFEGNGAFTAASGRPGPGLLPTLASFDADGNERWRLTIGTIDRHVSPAWPLAVTEAGDVIIAGAFEGVMDVGTPPLSTPPPSWTKPVPYLLRVDDNGKVGLARTLTDLNDGAVRGLALSDDGDAVVGVTAAGNNYVDPQKSTVARIDASGKVLWRREFRGLAGPVQLATKLLALASHHREQDHSAGSHDLVILNADTGETLRKRSWPLYALNTAIAGTRDGRIHLLLYHHSDAADLGLHKGDGNTVSVVTLDAQLRHIATREGTVGNGKSLASDEHGRVIFTNPGAFDTGDAPHKQDGPTFIQSHGLDAGGEQQLQLFSLPIAVIGDGSRPGQGVALCIDCAVSCKRRGGCRASGNRCVPTSDEDCRRSKQCRTNGTCLATESECIAGSDAACASSEVCKQEGKCASSGPYCHDITEQAHCAQSNDCKDSGKCSLDATWGCRPTETSHCRRSTRCRTEGRCHLLPWADGIKRCGVKSRADCARSDKCSKYGACSIKTDGSVKWCEIRGDGDCRKSKICRTRGACSFAIANFGDGYIYPYCEPLSDADCRRSLACRKGGRCRLVERVCAK